MDPARVEDSRKEAAMHLHYMMGIYRIQIDSWKHFLHEHPAGATSWNDEWVKRIMEHPRVTAVVFDQCEYGLRTPNGDGADPCQEADPMDVHLASDDQTPFSPMLRRS